MTPATEYRERPFCKNLNCENLVRNKGRSAGGDTTYGNECHKCHRQSETSPKYSLDNSRCSLCGWDKAPCDRHRVEPKNGYREGNVIPLCPNCHRLVTLGLISLGQMSDSRELKGEHEAIVGS